LWYISKHSYCPYLHITLAIVHFYQIINIAIVFGLSKLTLATILTSWQLSSCKNPMHGNCPVVLNTRKLVYVLYTNSTSYPSEHTTQYIIQHNIYSRESNSSATVNFKSYSSKNCYFLQQSTYSIYVACCRKIKHLAPANHQNRKKVKQ
jgi:hypothetical protein